jgi:hypothetical protein
MGRAMQNQKTSRLSPFPPVVCKFLAFLSACGLGTGSVAYIETFSRGRLDTAFPWFVLLVLGWMALFLPIYVLEYPDSRLPSFAWNGFARGMPNWVVPAFRLMSLIAVAHFLWYVVRYGAGTTSIVDGQYVLDLRGRILKVLTQTEYTTLRAAEVRALAALTMSFYFVPMAYWWYRRNDRPD